MSTRIPLLDERALARTLARMATEIVERAHGTDRLVLVGIQRRGVELAARLKRSDRPVRRLGSRAGQARHHPLSRRPPDRRPPARGRRDQPPRTSTGKTVVIVDDVLYTGRTVRAALDECADFGRPAPDPALRPDRPRRPRAADPGRHRRHDRRPPARATGWTCWSRSSTGATRSSWCAETCPMTAALGKDLVGLEPLSRRADPAHPRHRRAVQGSERAADQEGAGAARQDHRQPLLRGLHPHPHLLRVRREAALARTR